MLMFRYIILVIFMFISFKVQAKSLSLDEAIMLAVRENPNVQQVQLSHVLSKYSLDLAHWKFKPHYSFTATKTTSRDYSVTDEGYVSANETGADLGASLLTGYGTEIKLTSHNVRNKTFNPGLTLTVSQPLMRGFGRPIVEAELYNAIDDEKISRLNVESQLQNTVTQVINAYLDVVSAQKNLEVDQNALKRAEDSVKQTKLFIKAGRKAGVELVAVEADVANAETRIEADKNNLTQSRYALLSEIGLNPETKIELSNLDVPALIKKYHIPVLEQAKKIILENDIQYQIDQITIKGSKKRALLQAEDNTRWELNLVASASTGSGTGGGTDDEENTGINSLINGVNQSNSVSLELKIPIDDRASKNAVVSARIALREADIALQQEKWKKETSAITNWNNIYSAKRSLILSEHAEMLQNKSWEISFQKYSHGLIDSLELQSAQQQLKNSQQDYNSAQINYLKTLVNFDQLMGNTLKTWNIEVRYGDAVY